MAKILLLLSLFLTLNKIAHGKVIIETFYDDYNDDDDDFSPRYVVEDGPYGGEGGDGFTDGGPVHLNGNITGMEFSTSNTVEGIRVRYGEVWGDQHGSNCCEHHEFELVPLERIVIVQGRAAREIDALQFFTSIGNVFGPFGGQGGDGFISQHPECFLSYISGNADDRIDSLTFHWDCPDEE